MYSKELYLPKRASYVSPPRNYGGTAFSGTPQKNDARQDAAPEAMPKETPEVLPATPVDAIPNKSTDESDQPPKRSVPKGILASLIPPDTNDRGDIGFEELLLIGLMLLTSRGERDIDTMLILMLLLFYK